MTQSDDTASVERELTQLVRDLNEAVVAADVAVLERILHEDYVHNRPSGVVEDRAQYLDNRKERRVDFESLVPDQMEVRVYGDTAIVTGRSTARGKDQYGTMDEQRRWTRVLIRRDGSWQFVHFQATPITKS
jgi:ketosteroid isomerase-like protein